MLLTDLFWQLSHVFKVKSLSHTFLNILLVNTKTFFVLECSSHSQSLWLSLCSGVKAAVVVVQAVRLSSDHVECWHLCVAPWDQLNHTFTSGGYGMLPQPSTSPGPPKVINYNVYIGLGLHNVTDQSLDQICLQSANRCREMKKKKAQQCILIWFFQKKQVCVIICYLINIVLKPMSRYRYCNLSDCYWSCYLFNTFKMTLYNIRIGSIVSDDICKS